MASIARDPNGRRRILFVAPDGRRRTLRLGKLSQRHAEAVKVRIEQLVAAKLTGHPVDDECGRWVAALSPQLHDKLAETELLPRRDRSTLGHFLESYFASRTDLKDSTRVILGHTRRCLLKYFGAEKPLRDITPGDADAWRLWLKQDQELAENTARRRCAIAKQFFRAAVRKKLVAGNPFEDLTVAVRANPSRFRFITKDEATKVLGASPNAEWRLLFALARFGGVRIPSEAVDLEWGHVDWINERITIHSPKTEHHAGKELRQIPLFPELRPYLEEARAEAPPERVRVFTELRSAAQNLRTTLTKIIKRAGLEPWPKLWQNLRSSRETELTESFPLHVVCAWIGNSQAVAAKHYLQVTDEHFERGAGRPVAVPSNLDGMSSGRPSAIPQQAAPVHPNRENGSEASAETAAKTQGERPNSPTEKDFPQSEAAQNAAQQHAATACAKPRQNLIESDKCSRHMTLPPVAESHDQLKSGELGQAGLEPALRGF